MKDAMAQLGGRGGGSADMAQGGLPVGTIDGEKLKSLLHETARKL